MIGCEPTTRGRIRRWFWAALAIGIIALAVIFLLMRDATPLFLRCYLIAWLFLWGLSLGGLGLVMIHHLTGGTWGLLLRRILEAQMLPLPLVGLLFIPIALQSPKLYPWPVSTMTDDTLHHFRDQYFELTFVFGRAIGYFVLWTGLACLLRIWSRQEDCSRAARAAWKCQSLSGPGLVLYGVTLHFASIDWMMSLGLPFTSTIYGPIVAASQLLSAFALAIVVFSFVGPRVEFSAARCRNVLNDVGNLLLVLVLVWTYLMWCQAMLIWIADLKRDNSWWLARAIAPWRWISIAGAILGFALPLAGLLFRAVKQKINSLARIATFVLLIQILFVAYEILPADRISLGSSAWLLPVILLGLGAIWLAAFLWSLGGAPLAPLGDRNWDHARHLQHLEHEEIAREEALIHG